MSEYRIEPFALKDFPSLRTLFRSTFGIDIDIDTFQKKFDTGKIGGQAINYIAVYTKTNEIVAHFAALPVTAMVGGKTILAAQSSAAMTAEQHRKKGLFKMLAEKVHEECRRRGVALIFSQPNENSHHPFVNVFQFNHVDDIIRWDMKLGLKTAPLARLLMPSPFRKIYLKYCAAVLRKFKVSTPFSFTNSVNTPAIKICRDEAYLQYKQSPDKLFIQINGVVFWIKLTDIFWIGDIEDYTKVDDHILKKLRKLAFRLGYNTISFHYNKSLPQPHFLGHFNKYNSEPSTILFLEPSYAEHNLLLTAADFDTW